VNVSVTATLRRRRYMGFYATELVETWEKHGWLQNASRAERT